MNCNSLLGAQGWTIQSSKIYLWIHLLFTKRYSVLASLCIFSNLIATSFKAGKVNMTTSSPGLFTCKKISFSQPFNGGKKVKVFASFGHSMERGPTRGNGAAIWVESEDQNQFTTCVSEYGEGSNGTAEVNWIAVQSVPSGAQIGTANLDSWTTGTECKRIDFPQVNIISIYISIYLFNEISISKKKSKKTSTYWLHL